MEPGNSKQNNSIKTNNSVFLDTIEMHPTTASVVPPTHLSKSDPGWIDLGLGYQIRIPAIAEEGNTSEQVQLEDVCVKPQPAKPPEVESSIFYFVETRNLDEPSCVDLKIKLQPDAVTKKQVESLEDFIHKCNFCVSRFSIMEQLRRHLLRHAKIECSQCSEKFHNSFERDWHLRRFHGEDAAFDKVIGIHHFCRCCQLSFPTKQEICTHLQKCHQVYVEQELQKQFESSENVLHYSSVAVHYQDTDSIRCVYCNQIFKTSDTLAEHFRTKHMSTPSECNYCPETFSALALLRRHKKEVHGVVSNANHKPTRCKPPY
ncbi:zinc finger protein 26-like [Topomyia yanbarensis]|uniref:zinc finger protein 26-like n=1 Tax=Topomyia yanbarensis TaxID=2498891 RepID=UPI00273AC680|nr:zinc finger protein 26-like [Topomyia yanbarensis]XP_058840648.1 zinc finger protein 26-like [Topomyia yanbarensis]